MLRADFYVQWCGMPRPGRAKLCSSVLVLPKPRHKNISQMPMYWMQATNSRLFPGVGSCATPRSICVFNCCAMLQQFREDQDQASQHLNQKEKSTLLLKSLLLQLPYNLRDSHPAYECCGCICKREKVQRFAQIISSKICAPRCASICGVSACVFVYK